MLQVFYLQHIKYVKNLAILALFLSSAHLFCLEDAYAQTSSMKTQIPPPNTPALIVTEVVDAIKNFDLSPDKTTLICKVPGVYLAASGLQPAALEKRVSGYLDSWFVLNGKPVPASNSRQYINEDSPISLVSNIFILELKENDTFATGFRASDPNIGLIFIDNSARAEPSISSFGLTMFKIY